MRYAAIEKCEICNGNDVGVSLYVQGCPIHCDGCFNQSTWDFNGGNKWDNEVESKLLDLIKPPYIKRISILGGEPLAEQNRRDVLALIKDIATKRDARDLPEDFKIWLYTGYQLNNNPNQAIFQNVDYIVDGPYEQGLRDITLKFRGSSNQRVIDCKASIEAGKIVTAFE